MAKNRLGTGFATEQITPQTLPRADAVGLSQTGQGLPAQTLQAAGAALTETSAVVFKWLEREGNAQYDTARGQAQDRIGEFQRTNFDNSNEHDAAFKALKADLKGFAPKNKSGATKYNSWSDLNNASLEKIDAEKKIKMIAINNGQAYFNNMVNLAQITDRESFEKEAAILTSGAVDDKLRTPAQGATDLEKATDDWIRADLWRQAMAAGPPRADGEVDWQATNDWLDTAENIKGIDPQILKGLAETANARNNAQIAGDKVKAEEQREVEREKINDLIESNSPDAVSAIEASSLDEDEKQRRIKSIGKDVPLDYGEWSKVRDIVDGVAAGRNTEQEAKDAIAAGVGKNYSVTEAKSLRTTLSSYIKPGSKAANPIFNQGLGAIKAIRKIQADSQEFEEADVQIETDFNLRTDRLLTEFRTWYNAGDPKSGKPHKDEDVNKKIQSLTRIPAEKVVLGFFEKLLLPKTGPRFIGSEEILLARRKFEAFQKKPIFGKLSEADKEMAKKAFEQGATLDQIMGSDEVLEASR